MFLNTIVSQATGTIRRASEGIKLSVDQDNILEAARIIESEAAHFEAQVKVRAESMEVQAMGGDPVSREAARVLTEKLLTNSDSYVHRCLDYVRMLHNLARQLGESAKTYGHTEDMIKAQFDTATREGEERPLDLAPPVRWHFRGRSFV